MNEGQNEFGGLVGNSGSFDASNSLGGISSNSGINPQGFTPVVMGAFGKKSEVDALAMTGLLLGISGIIVIFIVLKNNQLAQDKTTTAEGFGKYTG